METEEDTPVLFAFWALGALWRDEQFTSASFSSVLCREPESHSSLLSKGDRQGYRWNWESPTSLLHPDLTDMLTNRLVIAFPIGTQLLGPEAFPIVRGWPSHNLLGFHSKPMEKTLRAKSVPTLHSHNEQIYRVFLVFYALIKALGHHSAQNNPHKFTSFFEKMGCMGYRAD